LVVVTGKAIFVAFSSTALNMVPTVTVGFCGRETLTVVEPNLVASCVDLAVMVAVPAAVGVKAPEEVIEPPVADQLTALLNAPVPVTMAVQVEV
jgi:hypothetical protein